jgi:LPS O-antigen subunit length determinant protein (WzzB/FepE family)
MKELLVMSLKEYLEEYRALTLDIMEEIWQEGQISSLLEERAKIINIINEKEFSKEEIKNIGNSLNLMALEEELANMYKKEKVNAKIKIEKLNKARQINNYDNIENISRVFNKSV